MAEVLFDEESVMHQKRNPIIAIVGPSGSGKSALIMEMLRRIPDRLAVIKTVTTRARRSDEDDVFYRLIDPRHFEAISAFGAMIQDVRYGTARYGNAVQDVDPLLESRIGITALVEDGVRNFRIKGYEVRMVRVVPDGPGYVHRDPKRAAEDKIRSESGPWTDCFLENRFEEGGFQKACDQLETFIRVICK